jgi:CRISPR/Cas system CSM-associated protein Csm3 (group 7 of RAMP superfamily)
MGGIAMKIIQLKIKLTEDTVFSETSATEGGHKSLTYIPGSALLGSTAAKLYKQLTAEEAWLLFHSGSVRFLNGFPMHDGKCTYPTPLCWFSGKDQTNLNYKDKIFVGTEALGNEQPKQIRSGFYTEDKQRIDIGLSSRMKTAIDPNTRTAKEAQLFDYQFIPAGQTFSASIQCDEHIDSKLIEKLIAHFNGGLLLGRSRSAEYGHASITAALISENKQQTQNNNDYLTLWLQSDLCVIDHNGQPNLNPNLQDLAPNLPNANLLAAKTHSAKRRYRVWNAFKRNYDAERQVLKAGSLLTFDIKTNQLTDAHWKGLSQGLGLYRENGLGQVLCNHPLTAENQSFMTSKAKTDTNDSTPNKTESSHPLIQWLTDQQHTAQGDENIKLTAKADAKQLNTAYESHRRMLGLEPHIAVGPSRSQWGSVLAAAKAAKNSNELYNTLFTDSDAIVKEKKSGWQDKFWFNDKLFSFQQWFEHEICKSKKDNLSTYLQHFAHAAMHTQTTKGDKE